MDFVDDHCLADAPEYCKTCYRRRTETWQENPDPHPDQKYSQYSDSLYHILFPKMICGDCYAAIFKHCRSHPIPRLLDYLEEANEQDVLFSKDLVPLIAAYYGPVPVKRLHHVCKDCHLDIPPY